MAARRSPPKIDQSRLAMTSNNVVLGLGFARNLHTVEEVIELLRGGSITGTVFVGVLLEGSKGAPGLKSFEGTEKTGGKNKRRRRRRSQRGHR